MKLYALLMGCLLAVPASAADPAFRVHWYSAAGERQGTLDPAPPAPPDSPADPPSDLSVPVWFPSLPELEIEIYDAEPVRLSELRGEVVLLDFWATWCPPCLESLPRLDLLYRAEKDRGLRVFAVNGHEDPAVALPFVEQMGLAMPIGKYDTSLDRALKVQTLPTAILADRQGRLRGRWNAYGADLSTQVAESVRGLLEEDEAGPVESPAEVLTGADRLTGVWTRKLPAGIEGLGSESSSDGGRRILVTTARVLYGVHPDGRNAGRYQGSHAAGALRLGDLDGDGAGELVSFRPGAAQLVVLPRDGSEPRPWAAPAPLFDLTFVGDRLLAGTSTGLLRSGEDPRRLEAVDGFGEVSSLATAPSGPIVLEPGRALTWLDPSLTPLVRIQPPASAGKLVAMGDGSVALLPAGSLAMAGRILEPLAEQLVIATPDGHLLVVDPSTRQVDVRMRWPGIAHLAVADLDGDGQDELLVAAGRWLTLLRASPKRRSGT